MITPLFGARVPVLAHALADPGEGDRHRHDLHLRRITDVIWWRELKLPVRAVIRPTAGSARHLGQTRLGVGGRRARRPPTELAGLSPRRPAPGCELLRESGDLVGEPRPITHAVKFYEKGDRPLEIVTSRQWFLQTIEDRDALLARGAELPGTRPT